MRRQLRPSQEQNNVPSHSRRSRPRAAQVEQDTVESIVPLMPLVLPLAGGVLMFLLASIAVYLA